MGSKNTDSCNDIAILVTELRKREAEHANHRDEAIARVSQTYDLSISHMRKGPDYQEIDRWCKRVRRQVYRQLRFEFPDLCQPSMDAIKRMVRSVFDAEYLFMPPTSWGLNITHKSVIESNYYRNGEVREGDRTAIRHALETLQNLANGVIRIRFLNFHEHEFVTFFSLRT